MEVLEVVEVSVSGDISGGITGSGGIRVSGGISGSGGSEVLEVVGGIY